MSAPRLPERLPRVPRTPPVRGSSEDGPTLPPRPDGPSPPPVVARQSTIPSTSSADYSMVDGFGSCLQSGTEAIHKRHEDELLALESLRAHIFNRAKDDKEYAEKLAKTNAKAARKVANISKSSAIAQAWMCFLEMSEDIQKQVSNAAAQMSSVLLPGVDALIKDKRSAKHVFDADRSRLEKEYHDSTNAVQTLRRNYNKYLSSTRNSRGKLETALAKDPPKLQEQDRYRKKFVGSAQKLHSTHNEYSLSILNANAHQEHHLNSLMPFCLDTLQQRMELQIGQWKESMLQYAQALDMTQVYEESFRKLYDSLRQVERVEEYVDFIKENKAAMPTVEFFEFDASLLAGNCSPQVGPGKIVVNNLTHNAMKARLAALETDLATYTTDIEKKREELKVMVSTEENGVAVEPPTSPSKEAPQPPKHVQVANLTAEVKALEALQARKSGRLEVIQEAVSALQDPDLAPLFDPLGEGVDPKDLDMAAAATGGGAASGYKKGRGFSITTLKGGANKLKTLIRGGGKRNRGGSLTVPESPTMERSPSADILAGDNDSDSSSLYDVPPEISVEDEEWYFGNIDRKLAESKCKAPGDYLVRYSEKQGGRYVLTCNFNSQGKHFVIQKITDETGQSKFRFESQAFGSVRELLEYHERTQTPVTRASGAVLKKFVTKFDKWSLRHSDVQINKKIGKGAFGDVFSATLLSNKEVVAVKTCRSSDMVDLDKFMKEAEILKHYDHPNIVRLIGVCAEKEPVYIVMEFLPGGAFLDYLRKKGGHQTKKKLCGMVINACQGMEYLESQHCIHRDLAARNCLVAEDESVKISDFGMSREDEGGQYVVSSGTRAIPIKWTAPEALNYGKYTSSSDVWSFGVLLWEAFSCGSAPYPGMNNHDARTQVEVGYRMPAPADCPQEVYGVMQQCWQYDPEERPDFATILNMLNQANEKIKT